MRIHFDLPAGWPWSTWFFIVTLIVYLLQRFPLTGIFLMIVAAALWSVVLLNLGMLGIVLEAVTGRVSPLWLALPALYFGGYYLAYSNDQATLSKIRQETVRFNAGKALPFDLARQDLVIDSRTDGIGITASEFVERFGVPRAFGSDGRVWLVATKEVCTLVNSDHGFMTAGIQARMILRPGPRRFRDRSTGYCLVMMPGTPDKPAIHVTQKRDETTRRLLPVRITTFIAQDASSGRSATIRSGTASPLKRFPMWAMGCALDSGTPAWRCFHGFMRDNSTQLLPGTPRYSSGTPVVAKLLGLRATDEFAGRAIGTERFQPIADRIDAEKSAKEVATLEQMLATPTEYIRDGWLSHLPNRPAVVAPYAPRIFDALETLQQSDVRSSDTGKKLWRLVEKLSDETLAPYRPRMAAMMRPEVAKPWTRDSFMAYSRLDVADPIQRAIVLERLTENGRVIGELLPPFCRMGASAPPDVKRRLLELWRATVPEPGGADPGRHNQGDLILYLTLARMGLKDQAGRVEQRYMGNDYRDIWTHITPDSPEAVCVGSTHEIGMYFRTAGFRP